MKSPSHKGGTSTPAQDCASCSGESRRSFCKSIAALGIGAVAIAPPLYACARMAIHPLEQTGLSGKEYPLTTLDNLDETPRLYAVVDTRRDAWVTSPNQAIGNVFIRKVTLPDGTVTAQAWQSVCPHAGCRIKVDTQKNPATGEMETLFFCPCHGDCFTFEGKRVQPETAKSARDMDSLETRVDESGRVFVKFQNFRLGDAAKVSV
ncbi:MAG: Rieske 2Fe-2S domain-containing protein [Planctomycetia bacterium]|nr:Rieske 2Fe-2S domain-containing protein [Planctomycetia bacterium]